MKKKFTLIFIGILLGGIMIYGGHYAVKQTGDLPFCGACHVMTPMVNSYKNDVHSGISKKGVKASCTSCHLPHDSIFNYLTTKAITGSYELAITALGKDKDVDWLKKRDNKEHYVYDSGCMSCHNEILIVKNVSNPKQIEMHDHYIALQNTNKQISCVSCHVNVGHKNLRGELNKIYPEFK